MKHTVRVAALALQPIWLAWLLALAAPAAATPQAEINRIASPHDKIALYTPDGTRIYQYGADIPFIPASAIKILTSLAAIDALGSDFAFVTRLWLVDVDKDQRSLLIQGLGDPLLVSEQIEHMADLLIELGDTSFDRLLLDDSLFAWQLTPGSQNSVNPYDAPNGALVVNFNTLNLHADALGTITSAEIQTPLTPLAQQLGKARLTPGTTERFGIGYNQHLARIYAHQLIRAIFARAGVEIASPNLALGKADETSTLLLNYHNTMRLDAQLRALLEHSNNYTANQIGMVQVYQHLLRNRQPVVHPISIDQAAALVRSYAINRLAVAPRDIALEELSGLSRNNRISLDALKRILQKFRPYSHLLRRYGYDVLAKSGTLDGVSNLAGFISTNRGMHSFIIHTSSNKNRDAILAQLRLISRWYQP